MLISSVLPENQEITDITIKKTYKESDFVGDRLSVVDIKQLTTKNIGKTLKFKSKNNAILDIEDCFFGLNYIEHNFSKTDSFDKRNKTFFLQRKLI